MKPDATKQLATATFRSPHLMNATDSALVVIDVQEKLMPLIQNHELVTWNINRLISGAEILGIRILATEQYPKGLGATIAPIRESLTSASVDMIPAKTMFSCRECEPLSSELAENGVTKLLLVGIEAHVCVAQSAFDFIAAGFNVYICLDAIGSRNKLDYKTAIRRMENVGVIPTTTEAALFEWCETASSPQFKKISQLVR